MIAGGTGIVLKGRIYPALADGATVTLHYYHDGAWHTRNVTTTRTSMILPGGYTARYSIYTITVAPDRATTYYFTSGAAKIAQDHGDASRPRRR